MNQPLIITSSFIVVVCFILPHHCATAAAHSAGNETDRLALLSFKAKITQDPFGVLNSWNESNTNFCRWFGVKCNRRGHPRVSALVLENQKLTGYISPYIGNLSFLRGLLLDNNSFVGEIPLEIGHLRRLRYLWLNNNSLVGELPRNLSGCSQLLSFDVSFNKLEGKIPVELGSLSKIFEIYIDDNNLAGGIPISIGNLSSLVGLSLTSNNLVGSIPSALGLVTELDGLFLAGNMLSGTIPSTIFNLSKIKTFGLSANQIQGILPSSLGDKFPNLEVFNIGMNQFYGPIPVSLSNASKLVDLVAPANKLTGRVPSSKDWHKLSWLSLSENELGGEGAADLSFICSLTNSTGIELLAVGMNNLGGMLPECLGNLSSKLSVLNMDNNHIYGSIPAGIQKFVNLADFEMWNNQLEGRLPTEIGRLPKLQRLMLSQNHFSGTIPSSLGNLSLLNLLTLDDNRFHGIIPSSLGNCQDLIGLDLSHNHLSGLIPPQIFGLSSLALNLDLSRNQLSGSLPNQVGNLKNLGNLNASYNRLSGKIPSTLGSCVGLESLDIRGNFFRGCIPPSWSSLRGIKFLDLSGNNISGKIPDYLGTFALQYLNLSFNMFEGELPKQGVFRNASAVFVNGNVKLCGGVPELMLGICSSYQGSEKKRSSVNYKLLVPIVVGLLGLISLLVLCLLSFCWRKKKRRQRPSESRELSLFRVSYQTLNKATDGFSSANLIGVGAFGTVYKGILEDGRQVAVKVFKLEHHGAAKSFIAECEAWRNTRHRNLVKIVTTCSSIDYQGNDFKAVVYEFMANGSLEEWLHPVGREEDGAENEPRHLNLLDRLNIAIDVAAALCYLHNHCKPPIVHCDIKPSNVLLDEELTGHIGDFGLARLLLERSDHSSSANQASSIGVRGSIGYTPPEYGVGSEMSTNGDVYSFGIMLLQMMTGKRPTDSMFVDGLNIHTFAMMKLPEQVADIVDPPLLTNNYEDQVDFKQRPRDADIIIECLISAIKIGVACSLPSPQHRMNVNHLLRELHKLKGILNLVSP